MQTDLVGYGDGINWYLYCRNNPLNFVDPVGREHELPHEVHINFDMNDYKCVGWVVLPMKLDPCDLMLMYDIKNNGFA